ncbi:50S ribosomal protein L13, partial [Tetrabaena socialis]
GKDKPTYNPKKERGDVVVVLNAAHVHLTHDKWNTKLYRWHTGYPGGLRSRTAREQWEADPTELIRNAVNGMLPKNKSREARLEKLKIFPESEHPFEGFPLVPFLPKPRLLQDRGLGWALPQHLALVRWCPPSLLLTPRGPGLGAAAQGFEPANPERYRFRLRTSPGLQGGAGRPVVGIEDLLTEEERRALAAAGQQGV